MEQNQAQQPTGVAVDIAVGETLEQKHSNETKTLYDRVDKLEKIGQQMQLQFGQQTQQAIPNGPTTEVKVETPAAPANPTNPVNPVDSDVNWRQDLTARIDKISQTMEANLERAKEEKEKEMLYKKIDNLESMFNSFTKMIRPEPRHTLPQREGVPVGRNDDYWDGHKWAKKIEANSK